MPCVLRCGCFKCQLHNTIRHKTEIKAVKHSQNKLISYLWKWGKILELPHFQCQEILDGFPVQGNANNTYRVSIRKSTERFL